MQNCEKKVKYLKPFSLNLDNYGLQLMKVKNPLSQNLRILHKTIKKGFLLH